MQRSRSSILNAKLAVRCRSPKVVHRADGSGTSFNFTNYLDKVSPDWHAKVGVSQSPEWPAGVGAKCNDGVAGTVGQTKGAIGYVEYAYANQQ